ncbi:MAG: citrate lyase holo-[acyl-carrier protein] synthase [Sulfurospirillum sp.]
MIDKFNSSILSLSINIPGFNKLSEDARIIFDAALDEITKTNLKILETQKFKVSSGYEAQIAIDADVVKLKKIVVEIEQKHPLGRFMDIDVISRDKKQITRKDIFMSSRVCFICDCDAKICARSAKHPLEELLLFIHNRVQSYEKI